MAFFGLFSAITTRCLEFRSGVWHSRALPWRVRLPLWLFKVWVSSVQSLITKCLVANSLLAVSLQSCDVLMRPNKAEIAIHVCFMIDSVLAPSCRYRTKLFCSYSLFILYYFTYLWLEIFYRSYTCGFIVHGPFFFYIWINKRTMNKWTNGWTNERWTNKRIEEWANQWLDRWMDKRIDLDRWKDDTKTLNE